MRDVIPPNDRSIRNIPVPAHRNRRTSEDIEGMHHTGHRDVPPPPPQRPVQEEYEEEFTPRRRRTSFWVWAFAAVVVGVLLAIGLSYIFEGATISVTPKSQTVNAGAALQARLEAPLGALPYQTIKQDLTVSRTVPTSGEAQVQRRASGTITISNTTIVLQRLIKNTRFESANGKIYRINNSVDVPAGKKKTDGTIEPGIVDTQIFADSPGPDYNQSATTFTIPGFKGDPRFNKFTARSKGAISGGFVGTEKVVSDADLKSAQESITVELQTALDTALEDKIPEGYILVRGSARKTYEDMPRSGEPNGGAVISIKGTAVGVIVKEDQLASALLKATDQTYKGEAVRFADITKVNLMAAAPIAVDMKSDVSFSLREPVEIFWQFDNEALKSAVIGKSTDALSGILDQFKPSIDHASVSMRPYWSSRFPKNSGDIRVIITK